jgi:hypothetical protein
MKIKLIALTLAVTAFIACKQKPNADGNTTDSAAANTENHDEHATNTTTVDAEKGVFFVNLKDGDVVKAPVIVQMGVNGMEVEPAGEVHPEKGHHHIIIDGDGVQSGRPVGKDATHIHYGKGQTSDTLDLAAGTHTLTLQFADGLHQSYGPEWSKTITITVEK